MNPRRRAIAAALAAAALGGCEKLFAPGGSPFKGIDVTGGEMGGELRLTDHHGKPRSLADFRGKVVVISFGFTHCPDVCPTALSDLAATLKLMGEAAADVQVLFVTVDPRRDTPELLRQYVPAFHPTFLGLHGDAAAVEKVKKDFHVYAQERPGKTPDSYTIDHSAQIFVIDRRGQVRVLFPPNTPPSAMANDLRLVLNS